MSVELPGALDAQGLWAVLEQGMNTIEQIPTTRFDVSAYSDDTLSSGRSMNVTKGNFIKNPDTFDHSFFQISPREARSMDPQQRILMRLAYNALENAGYCPNATPSFEPDRFGAFIGVQTDDYVQNLRDHLDVYYSTGTLQAFLSGRLSYACGFGGPSMAINTACSSSLVAIHQACRALTARDCNAALAGGVNIITSPDMYIGLARGHFLSETGQCRPWDASADGYCRSEGCGLFVLKRLEDALSENDNILGVIRGTGVNQSGNAHSITHPHVPTLTALLQNLVASAGVGSLDISVAECHGTGTQAGDPAELEALRKVFAVGRTRDNPLHITSIKGNIGHAEAASGAASLAKLILMLRHQTIPRHISFSKLNPRIPDLSIDNLSIDTASTVWACAGGKRRVALLTNFGASGSNSALILEEHVPLARTEASAGALVVGLSCKSRAAAEERRKTYLSSLEETVHDDTSLQDFAYSATARRQLHEYRIAASGTSKQELLVNLRTAQILKTQPSANVIFVFSGQGSQYSGMGRDLYLNVPLFARLVKECHRKLVSMGAPGILDVFAGAASAREDSLVSFASSQAALFVLEYALARMWISWGVHPCAVIGHSFGEFAALAISGVLSLDDALLVVSKRAVLLTEKCTPNETGMTSIHGAVSQFAPLLGRLPFSHLEVCCYNSDKCFVVGGPLDELRAFVDLCAMRGVRFTRLDTPYAFHSAAMEPTLADLEDVFRRVTVHAPMIPLISTVTGAVIKPNDTSAFDAGYLARHCRQPALFQQGVADMVSTLDITSVAACIEIGPHSTTLPLLRGIQEAGTPLLLPALRRATPGLETLCAALAQLYNTSVAVQWRKVFADLAPQARLVDLPAYPFAQTRFWVPYEEHSRRENGVRHPRPQSSSLDPHISPCSDTKDTTVSLSEIALDPLAELIQGHRVRDIPLCPASVYVELASSAAVSMIQDHALWRENDILDFADISYPKPLVYVPGRLGRVHIETSVPKVSHADSGSFVVSSVGENGTHTEVYCKGTFKKSNTRARSSKFTYAKATLEREIHAVLHPAIPSDSEAFSTRTVYDLLFPSIVVYSDAYRTIQTITVNSTSSAAYAVVKLPLTSFQRPSALNPVFVDTLFHVAGFLVNFTRGMNGRDAYICTHADKLQLLLPKVLDVSAHYGVYAAVAHAEERTVVVDVYAFELSELSRCERIVARLKRVQFSQVALHGFKKALQAASGQPSAPASSVVPTTAAAPAVPPVACPARILHAPAGGVPDRAREVVRAIAQTARISPEEVQNDACLAHLGVDSLMLWEVAAGLRAFAPRTVASLSARELSAATTVGELVRLVEERYGEYPVAPSTIPVGGRTVLTPCKDDLGSLKCVNSDLPPRARQSIGTMDIDMVKSALSSVLDVPVANITDDADLRSLGLDSLSSIEARNVFKTRFGVTLHGETLVGCGTVRDIAGAVAREPLPSPAVHTISHIPGSASVPEATPSADPTLCRPIQFLPGYELIQIQRAPAASPPPPPLILIHDGSGTVGGYGRLGPLGRDVWAVRNGDLAQFLSTLRPAQGEEIKTMAEAYAQALCSAVLPSVQPGSAKRECVVGGWSFGGVVALELAHRLNGLGVQVKGLVLIDAPAPQTECPLPEWLIETLADRVHAAEAVKQDHDHSLEPKPVTNPGFANQMRAATRSLVAYSAPADCKEWLPRTVYLRARDRATIALSWEASSAPEKRTRAFITKEEDEWTMPLWEEVFGGRGMKVLDIAGDHFTLFTRKNVGEITKQLIRALDFLQESD
ncbi:ketoacyl-synt-domain-containing protein [Trametes gibbosa]|nr:ketoacyl-synt-domain-containing protein [Trametes gibbosa]